MGEEINYAELFGMDTADAGSEGAQEPDVAEPAAGEQSVEGAEGQAVAEPGDVTDPEPGSDADPAGEEGQPQEQTPEERAKYAAARRKAEAERDAAVQEAERKAMEKARAFMDNAFAGAGLVNPYTKQPIKTMAEYEAFEKQRQQAQQQSFMKANNMSEEQYKQFVQSLPEVQEANQVKAQAEEQTRAAKEQQAKARLEEEVKTIGKLDPAIKDLDSLIKDPSYPEVYKLVQKGYALSDAYKVVNFDRIGQRSAAAATQQAMNSAAGKAHLTPTGARGAGAPSVPADVMKMYKAFMPNASEDEIRKHYARSAGRK